MSFGCFCLFRSEGLEKYFDYDVVIINYNDSNGIGTHNRLVSKRTLNHLTKLASLAKWLSVLLRTKWLLVPIPLLSLKLQMSRLLRARSSLTFRKL